MNPTLPARIERLGRLVWLLQALYKSRTHVELEFARSRLHAELDAPPRFLPALPHESPDHRSRQP